jgi:hypothetical protein
MGNLKPGITWFRLLAASAALVVQNSTPDGRHRGPHPLTM